MAIWFWFILSGALFALGEYASKKWALAKDNSILIAMVVFYCLGSLAWAPIIKQKTELARMGMLWMVVASLCTVGIGVFAFRETLSPYQWSGVALAVIAMVLIALEG